jgi:hypothetical protein
LVFGFYNQRGGAENPIKEANNDAGLTAHPPGRFDVSGNHFQLAMLAYNLNCWLMPFNRELQADATELRHTTLATSRLRFLFVAAKIWQHAARTGISYSDHYEEKGMFERLMNRLRKIEPRGSGYAPVILPAFVPKTSPPILRLLCIEFYARIASAMAPVTSARAWRQRTLGKEVKQQKIRLNYSNANGIVEEGPAPGALIVSIIQVK